MRNLSLFFIFLVMLSCHDVSETSKNSTPDVEHQKSIGDPIPTSVGTRWIENYQKQFARNRENEPLYHVTQRNLKAMMQSVSDLTGFVFHHAVDNDGKHHILVVPVNNVGQLWADAPPRTVIDANTNTEIDLDVAHTWAENYNSANPGKIRYHFFGADIFEEIVKSATFEIKAAINDEQVPQLLLITQTATESSGKVAVTTQMYDISGKCPPYCGETK